MNRKKRVIRVQSKKQFPSDFFLDNPQQSSQPYLNINQESQQNHAEFSQDLNKNLICSPQQKQIDYQIKQSNRTNCSNIKGNNMLQTPKSSNQNLDISKMHINQAQNLKNNQVNQRPFLSAIESRSIKSQLGSTQQIEYSPQNQEIRCQQTSKDNLFKDNEKQAQNPRQIQSNINDNKQKMNRQNSNNLLSCYSEKMLILKNQSNQITSQTNKLSEIQSAIKQQPQLDFSSEILNQKINKNLKATNSINNEEEKKSDQNKEQSKSTKKQLSIPNSPKRNLFAHQTNKMKIVSNGKTQILQKNTPQQQTNQKSQQQQRTKTLKCLNNNESKKSLNTQKSAKKKSSSSKSVQTEEIILSHQVKDIQIAENYKNQEKENIKRKSTLKNNFNDTSIEIIQSNNQKKEETLLNSNSDLITIEKQKMQIINSKQSCKVVNGHISQEKVKLNNQKKEQCQNNNQIEFQLQEEIEYSFNSENLNKAEFFEGEDSRTTKNSSNQNYNFSQSNPSIQFDTPYHFSDNNIQSIIDGITNLQQAHQFKNFYLKCDNNSKNFQLSPIIDYQQLFQCPQQIGIQLDDNNNINSNKNKNYIQNLQKNNNDNQSKIKLKQNHNIQYNLNCTNNDYNKTANFTNYCNLMNEISPFNNAQYNKYSQKTPKIALNLKQSEKYKPFLIRKVSSQSSMRVKTNLTHQTNNYEAQNEFMSLIQNGSSPYNGKSMMSTPTLLTQNEDLNSQEFSFCHS